MYTQSCFIRKNTPELRKKLEKLGYKICICCEFDGAYILKNLINNGTIHGFGYYSEDSGFKNKEEMIKNFEVNSAENGRVDCGTNEDLFLAIAALRDDTDKNQWFVDYSTGEDGSSWYLSVLHNIKDCFQSTEECHKATVEELIKHFNNK